MRSATSRLPDAMASPAPMIAEPIYKGCASQRYGPDVVTSRDLFKWPAAQIRNASPNTATADPMPSDVPLGFASHSTSAPNTKPRLTRRRASTATTLERSLLTPASRQTTFDGREDFADLDVEKAHAIARAPAQVVTHTYACP